MIKYLLPVLFLIPAFAFSQEKEFMLKGRILGPDATPVENAYIINYRDLSVFSSRADGRFNIWAQPGDSLLINHISFLRKKIYADSVRKYPGIYLEYDTVMIGQVNIGPDPEKLKKYVEETEKSIRNADIIVFKRMNPDANQVSSTITENNIVFRSQASSVSIVSFSPSAIITTISDKKKKKQKMNGHNFYRNEKQKLRKEKRERRKTHTDK